ncbi:hypothetical protein N7537_002869 [Penicillium hordei]|uniref:Uncharacterized protein n=1 Tax=Penicillium hordei TaxID=40994 RepID=A0AAD6EJF9_9EURO|nr:uncharacterized protein N7537_002869 [Penicillium hordei]KAJ5617755.1 hypothetical protein N7537_002869 [Penicillium hordei]
MSHLQKQEKTSDPAKSVGLTPSQTEHLLMGYLCMEKPKVDWKKLGELCNVTPSSARTVFTKGRRCLERWEENRGARAVIKEAEEPEELEEVEEAEEHEGDNENSDGAVEAAHAEDTEH